MKLWKENRIDKEYEMTPEAIMDKFLNSKYFNNWLDGHPLDRALPAFICGKDGLDSVFEKEDYEKLREYILKNYKKYKEM